MHNVLTTWLSKRELNKGTKDHSQINGEKSQDHNPPQKKHQGTESSWKQG